MIELRLLNTQKRIELANWQKRVPEIVFVLFLCNAIKENIPTTEITEQALRTYKRTYKTRVNGRDIPDMALIHLSLTEAKKKPWRLVTGSWVRGWKLTKAGLDFAQDIDRRTKK